MHQQRLVGGLAALAVLLLAPLLTSTAHAQARTFVRAGAGVRAGARSAKGAAPRRRRRRALRLPGARLITFARRQLGVPYAYGGASRSGFDCSGFTMFVYRHLGIALPHGATAQAGRGRAVSLRRLRPGDLVFWGGGGYYSHVAIYAGHGRIIAAPHTGEVVQYQRLSGASAARRLLPAD